MASGNLIIDKDGNGKGQYSDLQNAIELALEPLAKLADVIDSNQPSHTVYIGGRGGKLSVSGAAWAKKITTGTSSGMVFYSIQIDDPSFAQTLNLSAFPTRDAAGKIMPGEFEVVWRRPRQQQAA